MSNAIYLKHIKVIKDNPEGLIGKTIVSMFHVDKHSFFFKDQEGKMFYYVSYLSSRDIMPGLSLDQNPMIKGLVKGEEKLYIYPSIWQENMFEEWKKLAGFRDSYHERYAWVKKAFEFGIFNNLIKNTYLKKLQADLLQYAKDDVQKAEKNLEVAKSNLKFYESNS